MNTTHEVTVRCVACQAPIPPKNAVSVLIAVPGESSRTETRCIPCAYNWRRLADLFRRYGEASECERCSVSLPLQALGEGGWDCLCEACEKVRR